MSKMKRRMKLPLKIAAYGSGLMLGSMAISKVAHIAGPSASGISNMAQQSMGIAGLAMPITAAKGIMDEASMLYPKRRKKR